MASYFDEHNCEPLENGEQPNHLLDLARLLLDSGIGAEFELEFERIFGHVDGRKQPPAAKHIIENLPSINNFKSDEKCSICLKEFELNSTTELPCHHKFCKNCIIQWLNLVNSCPMCRIELPTDDKDYEQYKKQKERTKTRQLELDDLHNSMFS
ncbi:unnamed protein product [Adineta steineri]|uniref:E3 ubiquitin-protein ligase RNF181 n=1 Tax=Adineta steineri TaxID=433720 RepID=A0A815FIB5_9BILA|nr:unnamed protein product [Adineta steineri]CAF0767371.1 unnamed protein product [Adineta steineri]CAF1329742.1 unnamed protein product [Adineta steineri]CAF1438988.1 unnamed protein product [Adineta steineri]CAF1626977.1 unnamed protein product [Adineta steineri]